MLNDNSHHLRFTLDGHTGPVNALVSLEENLLASGSEDRTIKIWNLNEAEKLKFTLNSTNGHRKQVDFLVSLGETQGLLASGSTSETFIKIWDYNTIRISGDTSFRTVLFIFMRRVSFRTISNYSS